MPDPYFASEPDSVAPPGETILELLEHHNMSQVELARRMGRPQEQVSRLINARIGIEPETAIQLERTLGMSASFWMNLESNYREHLAREKEQARLDDQVQWLNAFPLQDMADQKWIPTASKDVNGLRKVLDFFGVASPEQFDDVWSHMPFAARQSPSYKSNLGAVAAWLRIGQKEAMKREIPAFQPKLFLQHLQVIRGLTQKPFSPGMLQAINLCPQAGVVVFFIHEVTGMRFNGAVQWLGNKPIMQLTLRQKRADVTWFSFFHEAGHIVLHPKNEVFIEDPAHHTAHEDQADAFARDTLIRPQVLDRFDTSRATTLSYIRAFSENIGIGLDILLGRLIKDQTVKHGGKLHNQVFKPVTWETIDPALITRG